MARAVLRHDKTDKIPFITRCSKRQPAEIVAHGLEQALAAASCVGHDIHDAITKLLAAVRRREIEQREEEAA